MPRLAHRTELMPSSPIRKLVEYAIAAEQRGIKVHYLNIGQPDIESPDAFWEGISHTGLRTLEYSHSAGLSTLREAMSRDYVKRAIPVDPDDILVTTGGSEATFWAFMCCLDAGDEVIVVEPFYANYAGFAVAAGVQLVPIMASIDDNFSLPDASEIEKKITIRTKAILLCNPSNPTGTVFPPDQLRRIAQIANDRDMFLIVDEVYREFYYGTEELLSVMQIPGLDDRAIMIDSVSKKFSLCGARIGFFVTKSPALRSAAMKFGQARLCAPTLDQYGVIAALRETTPCYYEAVRAEYVARRDLLVSELATMPGVKCPKIDGAFYAMVHLPIDDSDRFCQWLLTDFSYEGQTVLLAPATGFYITPGLGKQEVRIAYVLNRERIKAAMACLRAALTAYPEE